MCLMFFSLFLLQCFCTWSLSVAEPWRVQHSLTGRIVFQRVYCMVFLSFTDKGTGPSAEALSQAQTRSSAEVTVVRSPPPPFVSCFHIFPVSAHMAFGALQLGMGGPEHPANLPYMYTVFGPNGLWSPSVEGEGSGTSKFCLNHKMATLL